MAKNKTILAVAVMLLLSLSFISMTGSASVTLINGIWVHDFNLEDEQGEYIESNGIFYIKNNEVYAITFSMNPRVDLLGTDLSGGEPRTHKVWDGKTVFHPMLSTSWIQVDELVEVQGGETLQVNYTVKIPRREVNSFTDGNGFLAYIKVSPESSASPTGCGVGINYMHKIFVVFEIKELELFSNIFFLIGIGGIGFAVVYIVQSKVREKRNGQGGQRSPNLGRATHKQR